MNQDTILSTIILFIKSVQLMAKIPDVLIQLIYKFIGHWIRIKLCIDIIENIQTVDINWNNFYCLYQIPSHHHSQPLTIGITKNYDIVVAYGVNSFINWTSFSRIIPRLIDKAQSITQISYISVYGKDMRLKCPHFVDIMSDIPPPLIPVVTPPPPLIDDTFWIKLIYINHNNNDNDNKSQDQIESKKIMFSYTVPNPVCHAFNLLDVFTDEENLTDIAQQLIINGEIELNGEFIVELY